MSNIVERLREVAERADASYPAVIEQAADRIEQLEAALRWYEGKTHLVRLIHSEGDPARAALVADGGAKARAALENVHSIGHEGGSCPRERT